MLHKRLAIKVHTPDLHVEVYFNPRFERMNHKSLTTLWEIELIILLDARQIQQKHDFGNGTKVL
jgi:hypothetical protein